MKTTDANYTPIQLKLPVDMERIIEINDPVYAFNEVVAHIDLNKYFVGKDYRATGRPRYNREKVEICDDKRNSFSKTDHDATFMRVKKDYMGNDQLLPAYNVQMGICDGYIAVYGVYQYASDSDCFQPLVEEFHRIYNKYPILI